MEESIIYDCRWSSRMDEKFIEDFRTMCSTVFNYDFTFEEFKRKFLDNIYGDSLLVVVYIDGQPCAARALWRNDINGKEAYQPGDTCVLDVCRGKGIFSQMTRKAISMIPARAIIYNFPNHNSFHGYIKLGWRSIRENRLLLLTSYKEFKSLNPLNIDKRYFEWWIKGRQDIKYIKRFGKYFLIKKYPRPMSWKILSEVDEEIAKQMPKLKVPALIFYLGTKETFYNKWFATGHVVAKTRDDVIIPSWKIDAI